MSTGSNLKHVSQVGSHPRPPPLEGPFAEAAANIAAKKLGLGVMPSSWPDKEWTCHRYLLVNHYFFACASFH